MSYDHASTATVQKTGSRAPESETAPVMKARMLSRITVDERGCWIISGWKHAKGYIVIGYRGKAHRAHRLAYQLWKGPIPAGMVICHTCDVRDCCNPDHLFIGTVDTNNKDCAAKGRQKYSAARWTHCRHGHEFTPENTDVNNQGFRHCKTCIRAKHRRKTGWPKDLWYSPVLTPPGYMLDRATRQFVPVGRKPNGLSRSAKQHDSGGGEQ